MSLKRIQKKQILKDLKKKMVFIAGPRQVGKTWLALQVMKKYKHPQYLNHDAVEDRTIIKGKNWPQNTDLLVFDGLHKMPEWKDYLKGLYDTTRVRQKTPVHILVTGSAGLDTYRFGGDSLVGRFHIHHLLPLSPKEVMRTIPQYDIEHLLESGGFPQSFLEEGKDEMARWRSEYIEGILRFDILTLASVQDLNAFRLVFELLRTKVGSPVSLNSIAEDVGISPHTVKRYIEILEALYIVFRVSPFSKNIARAIKRESKFYFFDTGLVKSERGIKIENFVAVNLLKQVYHQKNIKGRPLHLNFLRKRNGQEVDFCIVEGDQVLELFEVKANDINFSPHLFYFSELLDLPGTQLVFDKDNAREKNQLRILNVKRYFESMEI